jgi:bacillithiol biosynthesis cysteine-adding enzyme BshC
VSGALRHEELAPGATLHHALLRGDERVSGLVGWTLRDDSFLDSAVREAAQRALDRSSLADAIAARLTELGAPPASLAAAERIRGTGSVVVVAGQQPVVLGGPHLVISKALAAIALARRIESRLGVPAVPVFWSASEDHDHGEADHVSVLARDGSAERLRLPLPEDRRMLASVPVPDGAAALVERLRELLPDGVGSSWVAGAVEPRAGDTMGDWFGRVVLSLLGPLGLVLVEPHILRPFGKPVVRHELERPGELAAALGVELGRIRSAGLEPPLSLSRSELFFVVREGRRLICRRDGDRWRIGEDEVRSTDELLAELERQPAAFSWNVAARVLAQNTALPVAAQVCGPTEFCYAASIAPLHERLGVPAPHLVSRPGVTWISPKVQRALAALDSEAVQVVAGGATALPPDGDALPELAAELVGLVQRLPEGLSGAERKRRAGLVRAADLYAAAVERGMAERDEVGGRRRALVLGSLRPRGRPQERMLSALPWLARGGPELLERWMSAISEPAAEHVVLPVVAGD